MFYYSELIINIQVCTKPGKIMLRQQLNYLHIYCYKSTRINLLSLKRDTNKSQTVTISVGTVQLLINNGFPEHEISIEELI